MSFLGRYQAAFLIALTLHLLLLAMLGAESSVKRPVLTLAAENNASMSQPHDDSPQQVIQAVSVDTNEVMATVNRLKAEKQQQQALARKRQKALEAEAENAKKARIAEQARLTAIKQEEEKIAVMHKKRIEEEKAQVQKLAQQKIQEEKRIAAMQQQLKQQKEQQEQQAHEKLAQLQQQMALEAEKTRAAKAKSLAAEQKRAQALQSAMDASKAAQLSGEVNKYKALITNAISQQWILPDNVNRNLSSQFRIRLAPNGAVLEVTLTRSSGDSILDRSAQSAIFKASPLPVPSDTATFNIFREISLTVRPESARG